MEVALVAKVELEVHRCMVAAVEALVDTAELVETDQVDTA
jgi:hypothetical protein